MGVAPAVAPAPAVSPTPTPQPLLTGALHTSLLWHWPARLHAKVIAAGRSVVVACPALHAMRSALFRQPCAMPTDTCSCFSGSRCYRA